MDYAVIVENAVNRFFAAGENEAHLWLLQVQASPEAWSFVWHLLTPTKVSLIWTFKKSYSFPYTMYDITFNIFWLQPKEVQFFAANTLYSKISRQWDEVPSNEFLALQHRLLTVMKETRASKLVLSKLCQAVRNYIYFQSRSIIW